MSRRWWPACQLVGLSTLILLLLGTGCTRKYFHESEAGDRYYQTTSGDIIRVSRSGYVLKRNELIGIAKTAEPRSDWDLSEYQVVSPSGHCLSMLSEDINPTPCYALFWEVPLNILAAPFTALQDALEERNLSTAGLRSPEGSRSEER
jgi:hypothetical protein